MSLDQYDGEIYVITTWLGERYLITGVRAALDYMTEVNRAVCRMGVFVPAVKCRPINRPSVFDGRRVRA